MTSPDIVIWLQERTALSILSTEILEAIAQIIEERVIPAQERLVAEDKAPEGLYILKQGRLEGDRSTQTSAIWAASFLPGAVIHLQELLFGQLTQRTITALIESQLWFIPADEFQQLVAQYPEITQAFSQQLAMELAQLSSQLSYEQERQTILRPYLVTKAKRGVIGKSRYAVRLRQQIKESSQDRKSVLIFGEPGLEKDNIAALIHFNSSQRRQPVIKVDCSTLQVGGSELFGRVNGKPGLLEWLGEGTIILNNIQELPPELTPKIAQLLETGTFHPVGGEGNVSDFAIASLARIIMIAEKHLPTI